MKILFTCASFLFCITPVAASAFPTSGSPVAALAIRAETAPHIDGELDDPAWLKAKWFEGFTQKFPMNGRTPSRRTSFAVTFDDDAIYFAVRCSVDDADEIVTRMMRRDRQGEFDYVEFTLSTRGDGRSGYGFIVNPSGVMRDQYYHNDTTADAAWDGIWAAKTGRNQTEWRAEIAVGLDQLRFADGPVAFGLQVTRWISALREKVVFNPIPDDKNGVISTAGRLIIDGQIRAEAPLVLTPESYISFETATSGIESRRDEGLSFGAGGYGKVGLLPDMILDTAMLPDFGQVEVDNVVLNLSAYETQFPEKRPFFLEGAGLFNTPIQLFYSRRLGQAPPSPTLQDDESVSQGASLTPILGAVKLTGRTPNGSTYGILDAVMLPTEFVIQNDDTAQSTYRPGTPWTHALALRSISEVGKNSTVGALCTALNPGGSDGAYAGGLDWNLLSSRRLYAFRGQAAGMARFDGVNGKDPAQGAGFWTRIGKEGGEPIRYFADYAVYSKNFDPNDLGYLKRGDLHYYYASIDASFLKPKGLVKQQYLGGGIDGNWNLEGVRLRQSAWVWWSSNLRKDWSAFAIVYGGPSYFDDKETRGGPPLYLPGFGGLNGSIQSPKQKPVGAMLAGEVGSKPFGFFAIVSASLFLRFGRFDLELTPKFQSSQGGLAYVDTLYDDLPEEFTIAGRQNLTELNITLKSTVVFTRDLTLQIHAQLLNTGVDYHHYGEVLPDGTLKPMTYRDEDGNLKEGDFARTDLVFQALLRWEYLPGSTLFLIYTHKGFVDIEESDADIADSIGGIPDEERQQVFMVKLSHRFG